MNHNMNGPRDPWTRLVAGARQVQDDRDASAPYGFATRVAALAFAQESRMTSLMERFAYRALGLASLLAIFSVALNYEVLSPSQAVSPPVAASLDESEVSPALPADDAVAIVLDLAD